MHLGIRLFEFFLEIGYKIDMKVNKLNKSNKEMMASYECNKKRINQAMRDKFGILVGVPRSGGKGNSNSGNTAKIAFKNYEAFASILKIDAELIKRVHMLICAFNQTFPLDPVKVDAYAKEAERIYLEKYSWKQMSVTLHRLFHHSGDIVRAMELPPGMYTEQASEARNKNYRNFRLVDLKTHTHAYTHGSG